MVDTFPDDIWVSWLIRARLLDHYPDLPNKLMIPEAWDSDGLPIDEVPHSWRKFVQDGRARVVEMRRATGVPQCVSLSSPMQIKVAAPLLADELYDDVFSEAAAKRYQTTSCAAFASPQEVADSFNRAEILLDVKVAIKSGVAHVEVRSSGRHPAGAKLVACLRRKLGLDRDRLMVPGEADVELSVPWRVDI